MRQLAIDVARAIESGAPVERLAAELVHAVLDATELAATPAEGAARGGR